MQMIKHIQKLKVSNARDKRINRFIHGIFIPHNRRLSFMPPAVGRQARLLRELMGRPPEYMKIKRVRSTLAGWLS